MTFSILGVDKAFPESYKSLVCKQLSNRLFSNKDYKYEAVGEKIQLTHKVNEG